MSSAIEPFNPENIPQAMDMAKMLASSSLIPSALRGKPGDVFVILAKGRELGLSPMQSLGEIYVVEGRPSASATLKVGLCVQRPDVCEYFRLVESSGQKATYETKRKGAEPVRLSWTLQQAQAAGIAGRNNWKAFPDAMLRARASSALASAVYPDLVQGLVSPDEAEDIRPEKDVTPPPAPGGTVESVRAKLAAKLAVAPAIEEAPIEVAPTPEPSPPAPVDPPGSDESENEEFERTIIALREEAVAQKVNPKKFEAWLADINTLELAKKGLDYYRSKRAKGEKPRELIQDEPGSQA